VIIGAQRGGTTSLYRFLASHPDVRQPLPKEVSFLSRRWDRGVPWYTRHFPVLRHRPLRTLEASPSYLSDVLAPVRAAATLPDARFVALLREPTARAISHYHHNRALGVEPLSFEEALDAEPERLGDDPTGDALRSPLDGIHTEESIRQNEDMRKILPWVAIAAVLTMVRGSTA
jgi:hypothetical protein